ncbi:(2Fe-2S)-binding protein [Pseudohalioglobus lutimaris]|uniref:(2Fe-2S)-binding protein n=1 Tax=Pseudohalioglobus lutimaris TaxID=1737061 RepID=A0A2N5X3U9_9GAMM|nr:(2Fe-2S)-binding protein [Pseudohalioglobus lutimaris]PLW69168.1 (2Fe-2S)-binding protein [Pseudohalioglobus lutimaris]
MTAPQQQVQVTVNSVSYERVIDPRTTLVDFLRHELGLTGTHVGCEHGVCGACTILKDGQAVRSCLMLAAQADGANLQTVESLRNVETGELHPIQQAFIDEHGLQCGFCTPGFLMSTLDLLAENPDPSDEQIKDALDGNLCRCTGYQSIIRSVRLAAARVRGGKVAGAHGSA